jgi:hypothetical protein
LRPPCYFGRLIVLARCASDVLSGCGGRADTEINLPHLFVLFQTGRRAFQRDAPGLQHIGIVGNTQRQVRNQILSVSGCGRGTSFVAGREGVDRLERESVAIISEPSCSEHLRRCDKRLYRTKNRAPAKYWLVSYRFSRGHDFWPPRFCATNELISSKSRTIS